MSTKMTAVVAAAHARLNEVEGVVGAEPLIRTALWDLVSHAAAEYARGVAAERARVVAWLRADAERGAKAMDDRLVVALNTAAFLIELGEHDKEGT